MEIVYFFTGIAVLVFITAYMFAGVVFFVSSCTADDYDINELDGWWRYKCNQKLTKPVNILLAILAYPLFAVTQAGLFIRPYTRKLIQFVIYSKDETGCK